MPIGAECGAGCVNFRVWAPDHGAVEVVIGEASWPLEDEDNGYFSASVSSIGPGTLYRFRLDGRPELFPDPASRFQPFGPHGPSEVICPDAYQWRHPRRGAQRSGQVIYEMHIGTYTPAGTLRAAAGKLERLARLGITVIELMPLNGFPGRFNWGYDGVNLFAPCQVYGRPDDLRAFADAAHENGLAVILDVVYNHLGPDGNYLGAFAADYFSRDEATEWGDGINFDGARAAGVREFFIENAAYWIREFRLDGLRLDATQSIFDRSPVHILAEVTQAARAAAQEPLLIVAENEPQDARLLQPPQAGGAGICALWNDDFHHAARVALTAHNEAYMSGYRGTAQEFVSLVRAGFLYQGQYFAWQKKPRGRRAAGLPGGALIAYLENHDQVANGGFRPPARDDLRASRTARAHGASAAGSRDTDAVPGPGVGQRGAISIFCGSRGRTGGGYARGAAAIYRAIPVARESGGAARRAVAGRRGDLRALQADRCGSRRKRPFQISSGPDSFAQKRSRVRGAAAGMHRGRSPQFTRVRAALRHTGH
jgi:maltooligosyltrehalose trehalohydrolase